MKFSTWLPAPIAFLAALSLARAADAPTDEQRWATAIQTFVGVLDGSAQREALDTLLSDHSWVAPFSRNRTESVGVLPDRLAGMHVVSVHSCLQPSVTSATDLAADVDADPLVADVVKKKLVPAEGHDLREADATMSRWFSIALEAQPGDPVALVALYDPGHPANNAPAQPPTLMLMLVRGEFATTGGAARISRVLYGSLESAVR